MKHLFTIFAIVSIALGMSDGRAAKAPPRPQIPHNLLARSLTERDSSHLIPLSELDGTNEYLRKTKLRPISEKDMGPAMRTMRAGPSKGDRRHHGPQVCSG